MSATLERRVSDSTPTRQGYTMLDHNVLFFPATSGDTHPLRLRSRSREILRIAQGDRFEFLAVPCDLPPRHFNCQLVKPFLQGKGRHVFGAAGLGLSLLT